MAKANALIPFQEDGNMPAHLGNTLGMEHNDDLQGGISGGYPVISYKGKTWALNEAGTVTYIMKEEDPDEVATSIEVVLVKANPTLSKVYYEGGYVEGSTEKPQCHSNDGIAPALDATAPQSTSCALCPHNAWGSRISETGGKGKACADSRRIAIVPSGELDRAMLLRVPAATLRDLAQYAQMLKRRNAPYQAVVTKIGFDPSAAYPKMTFKATRWVTQEEAEKISAMMDSDIVAQIIGQTSTPHAALPAQAPEDELDALGPRPATSLAKPAQPGLRKPAVQAAPAQPVATPAKPRGRPAAKPVQAAPVEEAEPVEEAAPAPVQAAPAKGRVMSTAKPAAKAPPPQSKLASKIAEASDDLDAALAMLDDV